MTYRFRGYFRGSVSATGPLCRCGSRNLDQDDRLRWRCERGHFANPNLSRRRKP